MPSGPKKRLRARRKKQGSPATDANSDRETEAMSICGSMDVDDLDSGLDTPGKALSARPSFLDREAVSSQTDEWVRVSDFDVGTPTSQTGENEPSAEYVHVGIGRRSMDKLAEWETVSGENLRERQEGSFNSLEEEPEVVSGHSSESYTHLPSPNPAEEGKGGDSSDSDRKNRREKTSSPSSRSSGSTSSEVKSVPTAGEEVSSDPVPEVGGEEVVISNDDLADEKEVVHEIPAEKGVVGGPYGSDGNHGQAEDEDAHTEEKALIAFDPAEQKELSSTPAKDLSEMETPLNVADEDKEVLPIGVSEEKSVAVEGILGEDEKLSPSAVKEEDVEDKEVNRDGKIAEDKEVASTSADLDEEKGTVDAPDVTFVDKNSSDPDELTAHSVYVKPFATSGDSESLALVEEQHLSVSINPVEKNLIEKRPQLEPKLSGGCCGVIYWLLGYEY